MSPQTETHNPDPSANATMHGLAARRPVCEVEAERMQVIYKDWLSKMMPETEAEEALVSTAAKQAVLDWKEKKQHAVRKLTQGLANDPGPILAEFEECAFGIDWLIRQWSKLIRPIQGQRFTGRDCDRAVNLMGLHSLTPNPPGSEAAEFTSRVYNAFPTIAFRPPPDTPSDPAAVAWLEAFITDKIARLEAIRPVVWESGEAEELELVEPDATIVMSKEGQLRHRYRRDAQRDYQRSLAELNRLRSDRSKNYARESRLRTEAPPSPRPATPSPSPTPSHSPNEPPNSPPSPGNPSHNPQFAHDLRNSTADVTCAPDQRTKGRTDQRTEGRTGDRHSPSAPPPSGAPHDSPNEPTVTPNPPGNPSLNP